MIRSDAVTRIQQGLGWRSDKSTQIITALQDAQLELETAGTLPWFLKTEVTSLVTVASTQTVSLPTDFLRESEDGDGGLYLYDSTAEVEDQWKMLEKDDYNYLRDNLPGDGKPEAYYLHETQFFLFPIPDAVYNLRLIYYKKDTSLSTDVENDWLKWASDVLMWKAGLRLAEDFESATLITKMEKRLARGMARMLQDTLSRDLNGRKLTMGGPD